MATNYPAAYDPVAVLQHPDFKIIEGVPSRDVQQNLAIAYAPGAKLHLIQKPVPRAREGEVVIHVRASGICGSDIHFWRASIVLQLLYSSRKRSGATSAQADLFLLVQHGRIGDTMVVRDVCGCGHECKCSLNPTEACCSGQSCRTRANPPFPPQIFAEPFSRLFPLTRTTPDPSLKLMLIIKPLERFLRSDPASRDSRREIRSPWKQEFPAASASSAGSDATTLAPTYVPLFSPC